MRCFRTRLICMSAGSLNGAFYKDTKLSKSVKLRLWQKAGKFKMKAKASPPELLQLKHWWHEMERSITPDPGDHSGPHWSLDRFCLHCLYRCIFTQNCIIICLSSPSTSLHLCFCLYSLNPRGSPSTPTWLQFTAQDNQAVMIVIGCIHTAKDNLHKNQV